MSFLRLLRRIANVAIMMMITSPTSPANPNTKPARGLLFRKALLPETGAAEALSAALDAEAVTNMVEVCAEPLLVYSVTEALVLGVTDTEEEDALVVEDEEEAEDDVAEDEAEDGVTVDDAGFDDTDEDDLRFVTNKLNRAGLPLTRSTSWRSCCSLKSKKAKKTLVTWTWVKQKTSQTFAMGQGQL